MQVQKINTSFQRKNLNFMKLNQNHFNSKNDLSFKGDSFDKNDYSDAELAVQKIKKTFQDLLNEKIKTTSLPDELHSLEARNRKIVEIQEQYKIINNILSQSSSDNFAQDAKIIADYLERMKKLGQDKGYKRISGYQDIKDLLKKEFILKSIMLAKTSHEKDTKVPDALLFYGPTNNGKSTFAKVVAEEALCNVIELDGEILTEEQIMNKLEDYAKRAKGIYESSGNKQRTLILVDEAEIFLSKESKVVNRFKNLIKNCADKYKCTFFLTTNHPLWLDKEILSKDVTPFKVGIAPADREIYREIITDRLTKVGKMPKEGVEKLVEAFSSNPQGIYSNGDVVSILDATLNTVDNNPQIKDYEKMIKQERPSISKATMQQFAEEQKKLSSNSHY